jgi:dihydrofolate reductase
MPKVIVDLSMSLDGFVAGPNQAFAAVSWRESHGLSGGEDNADSKVIEESVAGTGAVVMGRRMFSGGEGPWEDDPNATGWWGDDPPFHVPVFVLTQHARAPLNMQGGTTFTFVTEGIEAALERARAAAGDRNVSLAGGASIAQQYLKAGLVDELQIHVAPVFLGDGVRLFETFGNDRPELELTRVVDSPTVTHLRYRVQKGART